MDLIRREAVIEQAKASYHVAESMEQLGNLYEDCINALPSAFEGMTCGEIIEALFPIERIYKEEYVEVVFKGQYHTTYFTFDFWDSTYQKGE